MQPLINEMTKKKKKNNHYNLTDLNVLHEIDCKSPKKCVTINMHYERKAENGGKESGNWIFIPWRTEAVD